MKRFLSGVLACLMAGNGFATDVLYQNNGTVSTPFNIDAFTFINAGTFSVTSAQLFKTQSTYNYSNLFEMSGTPGFDFALFQGNSRLPAANFYNRTPQANGRGGSIQAVDSGTTVLGQIKVWATNIHNQGKLSASASGLIRLDGTNITMPFSVVQVAPVAGPNALGSVITAIYDRYWGVDEINLNQNALFNGVIGSPQTPQGPDTFSGSARTPSHNITNYPATTGTATITLTNGYVAANTSFVQNVSVTVTNNDGTTSDIMTVSNIAYNFAFVGTLNPIYDASINFSPSPLPPRSNVFNTITVNLAYTVTNTPTRTNEIQVITVTDEFASRPSLNVVAGFATNPPSYRPERIQVTRGTALGLNNGNLLFDPDLLAGQQFTNFNVDGTYGGYLAYVDNLASEPFLPTALTNYPGRLEINAGTLDARKAVLRAEGLLSLKARHLLPNALQETVVDCQNVNLDLGSTNGFLRVDDFLVLTNASRLHGQVAVWSGVWTNMFQVTLLTNYMVDPNNPTNYDSSTNWVRADVTNIAQVAIHVLMVQSGLTTFTPVYTHNLSLRATNVVNSTTNTIVQGFFTDAERFTLNGQMVFNGATPLGFAGDALRDLVASNAPNLLYLTNNGVITVPAQVHFGDDRATPYAAIVNAGSMSAGAFNFRTAYFENSGLLSCAGSLILNSASSKLEIGRINSVNDVTISGGDLKMQNFTLSAGTLYLSLTNALFDNPGSSNYVSVGTGFNLLQKPTTGDLLYTHFASRAPFGIVTHLWAGEDRGATTAGFSNNAAIGRLTLSGGFGQLVFQGAGAHNGLYVDFLNIVGYGLTNLQNLLQVDPSLTIYFAAASLPAEQLDGQLGGRLRWVKDFAGPNSSSSVLLPDGSTVVVNKGFRESQNIDSDADGLPNGADASPFDGIVFSHVALANQPPPRSVLITWEAAAGTTYRVEYATNLTAPAWQFLLNYTNTSSTNGPVTAMDQGVPSDQPQRYYRVSYSP